MSQNNNKFDEMMKFIENELTNLKTAHLRPLGALDFFHLSRTLTVSLSDPYNIGYYYTDFWLDVKIKQPDTVPPIVQAGWNIPNGFGRMDLYEYAVSSDYSTWSYRLTLDSSSLNSASFLASAVSSVPILSIEVRN